MTLETIEAAARALLPAHLITVRSHDGGSVEVPGLVIGWDSQDPSDEGWAYHEAQEWDPETCLWDGEESGALEEADLAELLKTAADRAAML